ncbi:V-set and immunoglobulin domain-containing protein 2 isoform X2 [Hemicordylus capensis]|uniref:V-set and immunoglobulin domain-containing protein 2 isoform X2 n=1 Tax=Hemicordylus capensis TaxID=884348 RepID=UPI00230274E5|nr:V-set and immunoglobulin domain-containing protein 2 isoform X2 [Hemicordylus capensis]
MGQIAILWTSLLSWLLFVALFGHGVCVEVTVPSDPVMQQRGSSVELPCHYKTSVDQNFMLEWRFAPGSTLPDNGKQILYFTNNVLYKLGSQEKRLSLLQDTPKRGDASIRLDNVRASDAGTYICEVNNPPDFYGTGFGLIHFTVLMPPSAPVCKGPTSAPVGSDATLTCNSSEGVPAPIYSWTRLDSKNPLPLSNMVLNEQTGKLILRNLSLSFSGTYQCVASNEFGNESCKLSIDVTESSSSRRRRRLHPYTAGMKSGRTPQPRESLRPLCMKETASQTVS